MKSHIPTPLQQLKDDIPQTHVICKNWLVPIKNISKDVVTCVTPSTFEKLIERNWVNID